jgi:membrane protein
VSPARELVRLFGENRLLTYASAVAFRALVALIPLTLLGIALLGALGQQHVWDDTLGPPIEARVLPPVWVGIDATVQQIFSQGGWVLITFAAALSLWDVSSAVRSCISGLDEVLGSKDERPTWLRFAVSLLLGLAVIACIGGAALVVSAGAHLASDVGGAAGYGVSVLRWLAAVALLGTGVGLVVNYGPDDAPSPKWATAGTAVIVVAWLVMSVVFRWFVASVANFRTGPGILAAFLVLTTYVYASSIIFMVGIQLDELLRSSR